MEYSKELECIIIHDVLHQKLMGKLTFGEV